MAKIIGNTTTTPMAIPDWNQEDSNKADYIKNKPELGSLAEKSEVNKVDLAADVQLSLDKADSAIQSIQGLATEDYVNTKIADMVDSAPATLNTLNELAAALGNDENFATTVATRIGELESQIADILYEEISITTFTHNKGLVERGTTVTDVTLSWETNKIPTTLTFDGEVVDVSTTSKSLTGLDITWDNNKTWTLKATDNRDASDQKTTTITFCNGIYYGVGDVESGFDSDFVKLLTKKLYTSKAYDFTVSPSSQYVYYAVPKRLGTVSFKIGGFEGGFEEPEIVSVTNSSSYTEDYYVYRSTNKLGSSVSVDVI